MSLFTKPQQPAPQPIPIEVRLNRDIRLLRNTPRQLADALFRSWSAAFDCLWTPAPDITPADRIAALGTDAAELFAANAALVELMLSVIGDKDPEMKTAIMQRVAAIPEFSAHEDGTVTLD